jgi:hypothetical protein
LTPGSAPAGYDSLGSSNIPAGAVLTSQTGPVTTSSSVTALGSNPVTINFGDGSSVSGVGISVAGTNAMGQTVVSLGNGQYQTSGGIMFNASSASAAVEVGAGGTLLGSGAALPTGVTVGAATGTTLATITAPPGSSILSPLTTAPPPENFSQETVAAYAQMAATPPPPPQEQQTLPQTPPYLAALDAAMSYSAGDGSPPTAEQLQLLSTEPWP